MNSAPTFQPSLSPLKRGRKPKSESTKRAFILSLIAHLGLLAFLMIGISWNNTTSSGVEVELWDSSPQVEAPPEPELKTEVKEEAADIAIKKKKLEKEPPKKEEPKKVEVPKAVKPPPPKEKAKEAKKEEPKKEEPVAEAVAEEPVTDGAAPAAAGAVSVEVDTIARPGMIVSGHVKFSDGQIADWFIDEAGRPGMSARVPGYRPTESDMRDFQQKLDVALRQLGF